MAEEISVRALDQDDLTGLLALYRQLVENDLPLSPVLAETQFAEILRRDGMTG